MIPICLWYYIRYHFESLFIFLSIDTLFVMIAWKERAQSDTDYIRRNVKK